MMSAKLFEMTQIFQFNFKIKSADFESYISFSSVFTMILICQQMIIRLSVIAVIICLTIADTIYTDKPNTQVHTGSLLIKDIVKQQENIVPSNNKPTSIIISTTQNSQQSSSKLTNQKTENNESQNKLENIKLQKTLENTGKKRIQSSNQQKKSNLHQLQYQIYNVTQKDKLTHDLNIKQQQLVKNIQINSVQQNRVDSNNHSQIIQIETVVIKSNDDIKDTVNDHKDSNQIIKKEINTGQGIEEKKEQKFIKTIESTPSIQIQQISTQTQIPSSIKEQLNTKQQSTKIDQPHIDGVTSVHPINQIPIAEINSQQKQIAIENNSFINSNNAISDNQKLKQSGIIKAQTNNTETNNLSSNQAFNFESEIKIIKIQNKELDPAPIITQNDPQSKNKQKENNISDDNKANQVNVSVIEPHQDVKDKQIANTKEDVPLDTQIDKYEKIIDHRQDEIKIIQIQKEEIPVQLILNQQTKILLNKPIQTINHTNNPINQPLKTQNIVSQSLNNKKDQTLFIVVENTPAANDVQEYSLPEIHQLQHLKTEQRIQINQENDQKQSTYIPNIKQIKQQKQQIVETKDSLLKIKPQEDITHIYFPIQEEKQSIHLSYYKQESEENFKSQVSFNSKKQEKSSPLQLRVEKKLSQKQQILTAFVEQDPQLPKDQVMDTQTIVWLIILTFIISIPVVRQIRSRGGEKQPLTDENPILKTLKMELENSGQYTQVDNGTGLQIEA